MTIISLLFFEIYINLTKKEIYSIIILIMVNDHKNNTRCKFRLYLNLLVFYI